VKALLSLMVRARLALTREDGSVATEYGLLLVLIALAIVVAATAFGAAVAGLFDRGTGGITGA
jgi:pilus assembly protein Flp/PilA